MIPTPENTGGVVENQCSVCARQNLANPTTCEAFPKGIPMLILMGVFDHTHPYDEGGVSDEGLRYEPRDLDEDIAPDTLFPDERGYVRVLKPDV